MSKPKDEKKNFGKSSVERAAPTILRLYEIEKIIAEHLKEPFIMNGKFDE